MKNDCTNSASSKKTSKNRRKKKKKDLGGKRGRMGAGKFKADTRKFVEGF